MHHQSIVAFGLVCVIAAAAHSSDDSTGHTANAAGVLEAFGLNGATHHHDDAALLRELQNGTLGSYVGLFGLAEGLHTANWVNIPLALSTVCVGHSVPTQDLLTSTAALAATLVGRPYPSAYHSISKQVVRGATDVTVVLPINSPTTRVVLAALVRDGVDGFASKVTLPRAVATNPRVLWVASDEAVAAAIVEQPDRVGFLPMPLCGALARADIVVRRPGGGNTVVGPSLAPEAATTYGLDGTDGEVVPSPFVALYPFVGTMMLHVKGAATNVSHCAAPPPTNAPAATPRGDQSTTASPVSHAVTPTAGPIDQATGAPPGAATVGTGADWEAIMKRFVASQPYDNGYRNANVLSLSDGMKMQAVGAAYRSGLCTHHTAISSRGSSAVWDVVASWGHGYAVGKDTFVDYNPTGSGGGKAGVVADEVAFAMSDSLSTAQERAAQPTMQFMPAVGFAVSVVVNLPGRATLSVPVCGLVGIMNGSITHWDHPALAAPSRGGSRGAMPHKPIKIIARSGSSGTTEVFTAGLARESLVCNPDAQPMPRSSTWYLPSHALLASTTDVLAHVVETPYALGIASKSAARQSLVAEMTFVSADNRVVDTDPTFVAAAVSRARYDPVAQSLSFDRVVGDYPFVGVTYYLYHTVHHNADCAKLRAALDFVCWSVTDSEAQQRTTAAGSVPIPAGIVAGEVQRMVSETTCNGELLYARVEADGVLPVWAILVVVALVVVLGCAAVAGAVGLLANKDTRCIKNAPKSGEVAIMFTDIQSSTKLWSNCPASMSAALEVHHRIIRDAIAHHDAYEVKTVGDSFMVACAKAEALVALAVEVQEALQRTHFPAAIVECYGCRDAFVELDDDPDRLAEIDPVWNGLRVRIGIHSGRPDCQFDTVTKGYDYYGHDVNIAARLEANAHGGQILCTKVVADDVASHYTVQELGPIELKGVSGTTTVYNVVCPHIPGRAFNSYSPVEKYSSAGRGPGSDAPIDGVFQSSSHTGSEDASGGASPALSRQSSMHGASTAAGTHRPSLHIRTVEDEIGDLPFVMDGTAAAADIRGQVRQMALHYDCLLKVLRPGDRTKMTAKLCEGWHVEVGESDRKRSAITYQGSTLAFLAVKVMPQVFRKSEQRKREGMFLSAPRHAHDGSRNPSHGGDSEGENETICSYNTQKQLQYVM